MRWVTYQAPSSTGIRCGVVVDDAVYGFGDNRSLLGLLNSGIGLSRWAEQVIDRRAEVIALDSVQLLAPIPLPPSMRDFNTFEQHIGTCARALGHDLHPRWYEQPVFYFSNPANARGYRDPVEIFPGASQFDYELEVAAVVGNECSNLSAEDGQACIAGYMLMCDWSARDLQAAEKVFGTGPAKGKDGATSYGPYLVTADELEPFRSGKTFDLGMSARVNGQPYSQGNLKDMHWSFGELVSYAARGTRLVPGDVIGSGTVGTGCILELSLTGGPDKYPWLRPGDEVELSVDGLGSIEALIQSAVEVPDFRISGAVDVGSSVG